MSTDRLEALVAELCALDEADIAGVLEAVRAERRRVAACTGDVGAIVDEGFVDAFDAAGWPTAPYLHGPLIVCAGARVNKGDRHRCCFVSVTEPADKTGTWVWDSPERIADDVRHDGPAMRSVTVIAATPGVELDVVTSTASRGAHSMAQVTSYRYDGLQLVRTGTRRRAEKAGHR